MKIYIAFVGLAFIVSLIPQPIQVTELNNKEFIDIKHEKLSKTIPNEQKLARRKDTHVNNKNVSKTVKSSSSGDLHGKSYIYFKESTNNPRAINKSSGACGLGQSLPCSKMGSVCPDWQTNYACQDKWFTNYMKQRYGTWAKAEAFHRANNWW